MFKLIKPTIIIFVVLVLITGFIYPLLITGIAQLVFPGQANGSIIQQNGQNIGSALIGQEFDQPQYFWGRLSAAGSYAYNASSSGGSNYSVLNPSLQTQITDRLAALKAVDPNNLRPVPVDLVTASGSGLDPNISIAAAQYQAERVARFRNLSVDQVNQLITQNSEGRLFGFLGEPRVNVLKLNLALDRLQ